MQHFVAVEVRTPTVKDGTVQVSVGPMRNQEGQFLRIAEGLLSDTFVDCPVLYACCTRPCPASGRIFSSLDVMRQGRAAHS